MSRHVNIPIFIPHLGCPNQCVFCNQRHISGVTEFKIESVEEEIELALSTIDADDDVEIAFFGGSFTGIDRDLMISLLTLANKFIKDGRVKSIRCSTRPDYIDSEILTILQYYNVGIIELGLQSSDDRVLEIAKRGHSHQDEIEATRLIKDFGFTLVGQMMIGLPGSTPESELKTAEFIVNSGAEYARIYPTIVFKDTELYEMCRCGDYSSLSLENAIERSAAVFGYFIDYGVQVIRIGLCSSENLVSDKTYYSGPNHPALGELIVSRFYYNKLSEILKNNHESNSPTVLLAKGHLSRAIGQHRSNKNRLISEFGLTDIQFTEDESVSPYELKFLF